LGESSRAKEIIDDYQQAFGIYGDLLKAEQSEDEKIMFRENQGTCLFGEGNIYQYFLDDPNRAMEEYEEARKIFEEVKSSDGIAETTKQMGEIYASPQFPSFYSRERADEFLRRALATHREQGYQKGVLETLYQLGRLHRAEPDQSLKLFDEYLELARSLGLIREQAIAKRHVADIQFEIEIHKPHEEVNLEPVIQLITEAITVLRLFEYDIWSQRTLVNCHQLLGEILRFLGNDIDALSAFREALLLSNDLTVEDRPVGDVRRRARSVLMIADILFRNDRHGEAEALLEEYAIDFKQLELPIPSRYEVHELITRLTKGG
jgi:tetratricopeptide (TPR) repeat protein